MVCTVLGLADPVIARVTFFYFPRLPDPLLYQLVTYVVSAAALVLLIVRERGQRTGRSAFPAMLALTTVVYALWFTLAQSDTWLDFARWFRDLPLT